MKNSSVTIPFGFSKLWIGPLTVHTGKIRVKCYRFIVECELNGDPNFLFEHGSNDTTIIKFATPDAALANDLRKRINAMLAKIMHSRIDAKYAEHKLTASMIEDFIG
jgi:hypothetical protein